MVCVLGLLIIGVRVFGGFLIAVSGHLNVLQWILRVLRPCEVLDELIGQRRQLLGSFLEHSGPRSIRNEALNIVKQLCRATEHARSSTIYPLYI